MLKELKKFFTASADNAASAESQEEVEMTEQDKATFAAAETKAAELTVALDTANAALAEKEAMFAELNSKYAAAEAALAASADAQAKLVEQAAKVKLDERTAKLSAIMGDVKGPTTAEKLSALDDASFAVVLDSYVASFAAEENSPMHREVGVAADATPKEVVEESAEMKKIKAEQAAARLQTN